MARKYEIDYDPKNYVITFDLSDARGEYAKPYVKIREKYEHEGEKYISMTHKSAVDGFSVNGQITVRPEKDLDFNYSVYAVRAEIENVTTTNVEFSSFLLRKVRNFMDKKTAKRVDGLSFGEYIKLVADALKITEIWIFRGGDWQKPESYAKYSRLDLAGSAINQVIREKYPHIVKPCHN